MMKKSEVIRLRAIIEKAVQSLEDKVALTAVTLFPSWMNETEYVVDDKVKYKETLYKCLMAHTSQETWTPDAAPSLWVRIDDPAIEWPEWVQPLGATDAYPAGAKVTHNELHWISDVADNVWEPGLYGWTQAE